MIIKITCIYPYIIIMYNVCICAENITPSYGTVLRCEPAPKIIIIIKIHFILAIRVC